MPVFPSVRQSVACSALITASLVIGEPAQATITPGPVVIGKSISGVTLGMSKSAVTALLGPADQVPNDIYFAYDTPKGLLQIFFDADIVTQVMASGADFCVLKGPCLESKGMIAALKKSNKTAKKVLGEDSDYLEITTKVGTKKRVTSFSLDGTTSLNVTLR